MRPSVVRPTIIAVLLGLAAVFAAIIATQAVSASRDRRATVERVLQDYAALGAEGVAQRLRSSFGNRLTTVLSAGAGDPGDGTVFAAAYREAFSTSGHNAANDVSHFRRIGSGDALAPAIRAFTAALPSYVYFGMRWIPTADGEQLLVFQPMTSATAVAASFTLSREALSTVIAALVAKDRVLPASLTHGASLDGGVGLRISSGHQLLVNRHFDQSSPYRSQLPLGQPYGDLSVDVSLSESIAPSLIIGGLPRSRVALLVALVVLTIALTAAAGDQLRRELVLSRLRDDFVSSASHELRTPLAQIRLFAETLRLGRVRSADEGDKSLAIIENESRRLEHLVENLLYFSRAERSGMHLARELTDVSLLIDDVVTGFAPLAARTACTIAVELERDAIMPVDPSAIRQIVLNLLDNAVKYGGSGQVITVGLTFTETECRIDVIDQGTGIPVDERARVWERFWRSDSARRSGVTGTGVGLAIVNDLVRLHEGTASVASSPTGGACIVIRLPRRTA